MSLTKKTRMMTFKDKIRLFNGEGNWNTYSAGKRLPYITMSDGPHGIRFQDNSNYADINKSHKSTCFPTASSSACTWNRELLFELGKALAEEAAYFGVNIVLGPGINIKRSPFCGRNFEYFSEDPLLTAECASAIIKGLQSKNTGACIKHFACNNQEKRRQTSNSIVDERTLNETYLKAFEIAIKKSNPAAIMTSYNRLNGIYTGQNPYLFEKLKTWNYKGLVISDWGAAIEADKCLKAGMNLSMPDSQGYIPRIIEKALEKDCTLTPKIENSAEKILTLAEKFQKEKITPDKDVFSKNRELALRIAEESIVLLKNNGILPLQKEAEICLKGHSAKKLRFQGGGSSHINALHQPDLLSELKKTGLSLSKKAEADSIILFLCGLPDSEEGEGFDRNTLKLPEDQIKEYKGLQKNGNRIIVVNISGSPVDLSFAKNADAIIQMYLSGQECDKALCNILTGKINPSGRLGESWPVSEKDFPCTIFSLESDNIEYSEQIFAGYRWYETKKIPLQFEFGYGLSYTSFEYSSLKIESASKKTTVTLDVKNSGKRDGFETVQLYIKNPGSTEIIRPSIELDSFCKVFVKAGDSKTVKLELSEYAFTVYSTIFKKYVRVEGEYKICAGSSVRNIKLSEKIQIQGEKLSSLFEKDYSALKKEWYVCAPQKGSFTKENSLSDLAKKSIPVKILLSIFIIAIRIMNFGKSKNDPAVKIALNAIKENPLESLISTSGGAITEKFADTIVKISNRF